jgi:hypothetical protein
VPTKTAPTAATIVAFLAATATGTVRAGKCGISRSTLERLVAAGIAKRIETVGHGWAGPNGTDAPRHFPSMVRYDRASR